MGSKAVVTGLGVISPIGEGREVFWRTLLSGKSGISEVSAFDTSQFRAHLASEVKAFDPTRHVTKLSPEAIGRTAQLAVGAARFAVEDAGLDPSRVPSGRLGVAVGTTMGEQNVLEKMIGAASNGAHHGTRTRAGGSFQSASELPKFPHYQLATHVLDELEIENGTHIVFGNACASGNYAIGYASDQIALDKATVMLAGGAEAFSRIAFTGFSRLGAIAPELCQPFDVNRKGAIFGEGAAMMVLEAEDHARARKANILAEVAGYGVSCDAFHLTAPHPDGMGALTVMRNALRNASVAANQVSSVNAHGTGTVANDRSEAAAIRTLFGNRAKRVPVTSIKSSIGHTMGAASAIEAVSCVLGIVDGVVPPTIHHYETDPRCAIDVVGREAVELEADVVLNNSFGFGGNNCCTVFRRWNH